MSNLEKHIENLKKYINEDFTFREPIKNMSDFDKYCWNHCKDIEAVIKELENAQSDLYEANKRIADLLFILGDKDRMINEMAKYIDDFQMECNKYYKDKEDVIKTFEERCKNAKD